MKKSRPQRRPGFTARLSEPPACSAFDPRPDAPESIVSHSPATPFGAHRVRVTDASSIPASRRSRKLGTAFRSPATTLSPPLRGQCSRPAPSLPRRCFLANPFDRRLLRSVRFRSRNRANSTPSTRCPRRSPALPRCHPIPTPLQVFQPSGSKRSTGFIAASSPRLTPDCLSLPAARSFDFASDRRSKPVFVLLG